MLNRMATALLFFYKKGDDLLINAKLFLKKHSSTILACLGCAGVIATSVTAVRATPKAIKLLEEAEENKGSESTTWATAKTTTKSYLPSISFGV